MRTLLLIAFYFFCLTIQSTSQDCGVSIEFEPIDPCNGPQIEVQADVNGSIFSSYWTHQDDDHAFNEDNLDLDINVNNGECDRYTLHILAEPTSTLIVNGDFESGHSGFTSGYSIGTSSCYGLGNLDCEGTYDIIDDPLSGHTSFAPCGAVNGPNMMVVNGDSGSNDIWCQDVAVDPDGVYIFSAWAASVNPNSPAVIQFAIDGQLVGNLLNLPGSTCDWQEFYTVWAANGQTSIEICITNQNTAAAGNDFALDDIFFGELCRQSKEIEVCYYDLNPVNEPEHSLTCEDASANLSLEIEDIDLEYSVLWYGPSGESIPEGEDEFSIEASQEGTYSVVIEDEQGCIHELEFEVDSEIELPQYNFTQSGNLDCSTDTVMLLLEGDLNDELVSWFKDDTLINSNNDTLYVSEPGEFKYVIDLGEDCVISDSVTLTFDTLAPQVVHNAPLLHCGNLSDTVRLLGIVDSVVWELDGEVIASNQPYMPVDRVGQIEYTITGDNGCQLTDSIVVDTLISSIDALRLEFNALLNCKSRVDTARILTISPDIADVTWFNEGAIVSQSDSLVIQNSGNFEVVIVDTLSCQRNLEFQVLEDFNQPMAEIHGDTISCGNSAVELILDTANVANISWYYADSLISNNLNINTSISGEYTVVIEAANFCTDTIHYTLLEETTYPEIDINVPATWNCLTTEINLSAQVSSAVDLNWTDYNGTPLSDNIDVTVYQGGTYYLEAVSSDDCVIVDSIEIHYDTIAPTLEVDDIMLDCIVNSAIPNYTTELGVNVSLNGPDDITFSPVYEVSSSGTYVLGAEADNGCLSYAEFNVDVDTSSVMMQLSADALSCRDQSSLIIIEAGAPYTQAVLIDSQGDSTNLSQSGEVLVDSPGSYNVELTGSNGCVSAESILIESIPPIADVDFSFDLQPCSENATLTVLDVIQGSAPFNLYLEGEEVTSPVDLSGNGDYSFTMVDAEGCQFTWSATVAPLTELSIGLEAIIEVELGDSVILTPDINIPLDVISSIVWSPADNLSCDTCYSPSWTGIHDQDISLTVRDSLGCEAMAETRIIVDDDLVVEIPNVFVSGRTDSNGYFTLFTEVEKVQEIQSMMIYDRWGSLMFDTYHIAPNDHNIGWNGDEAMSGVYVYIIELLLLNGEVRLYSGDVTLLH